MARLSPLLFPLLSALLLLTGCGGQETASPDLPVPPQAGRAVCGTVRYDSGNTVSPCRISDYYINPDEGICVFVDYPDYYQSDGDGIAGLIRQAAYNGWTIDALTEYPNTTVTVDYEVTRNDARYFSAAFLFCAITRGGAHPAVSEYAVTIDRAAGRRVLLSDLLRLDGPEDLERLIPKAFTALGNWSDLPPLEELAAQYTDPLAYDGSKNFYLTDNTLCLIVSDGRDHYVLESPLSSLPLLLEP